MEFADVVRRRRMVRNYTDEPVDPAVVDRALAHAVRAPSAGLQPGLGLPGARHPRRRTPLLGRHRRRRRRARRVAARHDARAGRDRAVLEQGGLPRSLRRARQGLDRPRRGALAGAVLAHGRRDGLAADPADRGRRGARRLLLRHPAGQGPGRSRGVRHPGRLRPGRRDHARAPGRHRRRAGVAQPAAAQGPRTRSCTAAAGARPADMGPVHPIRARDATGATRGCLGSEIRRGRLPGFDAGYSSRDGGSNEGRRT